MISLINDYQKRPGTINLGDEYEHLIPALFAIRTICRPDVVDMWLASNAEGMGAFDDVVFYVEFQDGQKKAYVIQLKHKGCAIAAAAFTNNSGSDDYSILKYQNSFEEIMENKKTKINSILENIDTEDIRFVMYTTADLAQTIDKNVMKKLNLLLYPHDVIQNEFSLLNTSTNQNCVYKFKMEDQNKGGYNETFLSQFYFYVSQASTLLVEDLIQQIISETFSNSDINVKLNLLNFIKMWVRGDLGGHYKLRKNEFQLKLTELLLNSYLVIPKTFIKFKKSDVWNAVVKTAEIIIVNNYKEETISMLWTAIKFIIYNHTDKKLKEGISWENSIDMKLNDLPKKFKKQALLHNLALKQIGTDRQLTMKCLYIVLWKAGLIPLLVKADDVQEAKNIFAAVSVSSGQTINRQFVLLFKGEDNILTTYCGNQSVLQTLADIKDVNLIQTVLGNMEISLQGRNAIFLSKIIAEDSDLLKEITIEMLLWMLYQPLVIGRKYEDLPENYIKRYVSKVVLNEEILKSSDDVFIINGSGDILNDIKMLTDSWRVIDGKSYFKEISTNKSEKLGNIVVLEEGKELNVGELRHLITNKYNFHYLRYYNRELEWSHSAGQLDSIRKYINASQTYIQEEDILRYFSKNINIISSNPGMGKSVMIKCLAKTCTDDFWVETIILNNHHKYFKQNKDPYDFEYCNFLDDTSSVYESFTTSIISTLKKQKKVYVLIDAFDEISSDCVNPVINLVKYFQKLGYRLWITTRPSHSEYLETKLNTFSISLKPFTANDQKTYLTKLFYKKKKDNIERFVKKLQNLMSKSFSNWDVKFFGVPLHLQMVAEVFAEKNIADLNELDKISSVDLYEAFINNKLDLYWRKLFGDNINGLSEKVYEQLLEDLKNKHEKASLLLFFPKASLISLDLVEIEKFLKNPITRDVGIIIAGDDWEQPAFSHRTFAEFLAAKYLANNWQNKQIKTLLVTLFNEELIVVRQLFDRILAKGYPLHLAVLDNNLDEVNNLLEKRKGNSNLDYDLGGRTPLHLAAAQGSRHKFPIPMKSITMPDRNVNLDSNSGEKLRMHLLDTKHYKVKLVDPHILKILLQVFNTHQFEKHCDNILGWYAIDYACHTYSLDALEIMFATDQSDNILDFFEKISLIYYCVKYSYKNILTQTAMEHGYVTIDEGRQNLLHIAVNNPGIVEIMFNICSSRTMRLYLLRKDWKGDLPIMCSAMNGNLNVFQFLLNSKVGLNHHNMYGLTTLHILVFYEHMECLERFVMENGIDLNARAAAHRELDYSFKNPGHTALYFAVNKNNLNIIELLIQNGADVHLTYENERTLLHVASINGFTDTLQKLFNSGAKINVVDNCGRTPLHYAAQNSKINSTNLLLKLGADINITDIFGQTPLHYAIQNFRLDRIEYPKEYKIDMNIKDTSGRTMLHYVAQKITVGEQIKFLLPIGKDMSNWHHYGKTRPHRATSDDGLANIDFLIKYGVNPTEGDNNGRTPLHYAVQQNILENIECLVKLGANINHTDKLGQTPLFQATQSGKLDTFKFLLQFSPDVDKSNIYKVSPIHLAAEMKFNKSAMLLIESGANLNLSTCDGCTPLLIAVRKNNQPLVRLLVQNKANVNKPSHDTFVNGNANCVSRNFSMDASNSSTNMLSPLQIAIQIRNMKIIKILLESKAKINQTDNNGWTALHFAAHEGRAECIDSLVNRGAELHKQNNEGSTPIHLATKRNHCNTLETILEAKRSKAINWFNNEMQTPLHIACCNGCLVCVKLLIEKGADFNLRSGDGFTPLELAVNQGLTDIQQYLDQLLILE